MLRDGQRTPSAGLPKRIGNPLQKVSNFLNTPSSLRCVHEEAVAVGRFLDEAPAPPPLFFLQTIPPSRAAFINSSSSILIVPGDN